MEEGACHSLWSQGRRLTWSDAGSHSNGGLEQEDKAKMEAWRLPLTKNMEIGGE